MGRCDVKLCSCIPVFEDEKVNVKPVHMVEWRCRSTQSLLSAIDGIDRHRYALNRRLGGPPELVWTIWRREAPLAQTGI